MFSKADLLRRAVSTGVYDEAERLLEAYRLEVEISWRTAATAAERNAISTEVLTLLRWARHTMLAARSHAQSKVIHLSRQGAYLGRERVIDQLQLDA